LRIQTFCLFRSLSEPDGSCSRTGSSSSCNTSKTTRTLCRELAAVRRKIEIVEQQFIQRTGYRPSQVPVPVLHSVSSFFFLIWGQRFFIALIDWFISVIF
jgi:hypothetical protein